MKGSTTSSSGRLSEKIQEKRYFALFRKILRFKKNSSLILGIYCSNLSNKNTIVRSFSDFGKVHIDKMKPFVIFSKMLQSYLLVIGEKTQEVTSSCSGKTDYLNCAAGFYKLKDFFNLLRSGIFRIKSLKMSGFHKI